MPDPASIPSNREEHLRRAEQLAASSLDLTAKVDTAAAIAAARLYLDCAHLHLALAQERAKETTHWDGEQWITSLPSEKQS